MTRMQVEASRDTHLCGSDWCGYHSNLRVVGADHGTIIQNVKVEIALDGDDKPCEHHYAEAWGINCGEVAHGGADMHAVSMRTLKIHKAGKIEIRASAFYVDHEVHHQFSAVDAASSSSGVVPSAAGVILIPAASAPQLHRGAVFVWDTDTLQISRTKCGYPLNKLNNTKKRRLWHHKTPKKNAKKESKLHTSAHDASKSHGKIKENDK